MKVTFQPIFETVVKMTTQGRSKCNGIEAVGVLDIFLKNILFFKVCVLFLRI